MQGGLIYFAVEKDKLPGNYHLSYAAKETGITLTHVQGVSIVDMVVQGFRIDGINAANSARDIRLVHITARGNGRSGIAVGGACVVGLKAAWWATTPGPTAHLPVRDTHHNSTAAGGCTGRG